MEITIAEEVFDIETQVKTLPGLDNNQVENIQTALSRLPQYEPITDHYFHGGMYCRKVSRIAGALVVGKVHKKEHFYICVTGQMIVWNENGATLLNAGDVLLSPPGTKRVVYAITDAIGMTMHIVNAKTIEEAETELVEEDLSSTYSIGNKVKIPTIEEINSTIALIKDIK